LSLFDLVLGRPIATADEQGEHIGPLAGIPVFGLDALSSAAYGPEAALTLLIPLGLLGLRYILPVTAAILVLLTLVFFSYLQMIEAYPNGGGSYTVATENLGERAGLLAAAALMIDYILNAAVGISAGVGAVISAFPWLQPHTTVLCLAVLAALALVNLRGVKDSGLAFLTPTYLFCGSLLFVIGMGLWRTWQAGGHPAAIVAPPRLPRGTSMLPLWVLAKVFASGCTAMTGVEAVSNGVMAFRRPAQRNAKKTLTVIIVLLMALLAGIALLCRAYGIGATDPNGPGYQSVLSQLIGAVMGRGWFYYLAIGAIFAVLALSANTSFADFPRLTRAIAMHDFLPHVFLIRGRRLLYTHGIYALVGFTAVLLIAGGHGGALEAHAEQGIVAARSGELSRRNSHGADADGRSGRQVSRRRMDHRAADPVAHRPHAGRAQPLRRRQQRDRDRSPDARGQPDAAAGDRSGGPVVQDCGEGTSLRAQAQR
jgi:amino acid transporter